jgi:hypothetical protein
MFRHFLMGRFSNVILHLHIGIHVKNAFSVQFCHTNSEEEGGREQMMLKASHRGGQGSSPGLVEWDL